MHCSGGPFWFVTSPKKEWSYLDEKKVVALPPSASHKPAHEEVGDDFPNLSFFLPTSRFSLLTSRG